MRKDTGDPTVTPTRPDRPFARILIANRGEIAVRVIRACGELGIESVAVYSDPDAHALHVRMADAAVRIGTAAATDSYLVGERIIEAALATGAQAIHPGYGFVSEQATFAAAVEAAGLVFVGPTPATLASLGDKIAARRAATAHGVPIVPGTFEPLPVEDPTSIELIASEATRIGYPLLVKAAAGGGGRGMRRVDDPRDLPIAVASATREAAKAFGDGSVYLEAYVEGGRHVEVQLLGDVHGTIAALGERDCSAQRRHQKLVEESPAPGLTPHRRRELHALAVKVARSVGLRNAATAEFLLSQTGAFYFLEVNARLQVEHGVTEMVTGVDLVHEQLWIAAGYPISPAVHAASARAADPDRHAIELRISAEDPARSFAPMPGTLTRWREPGGPGVRVDSGVEAGWHVTGDYDPLLAKLLVVATDRPAAIARARRALSELDMAGVQTTAPFHHWLLRDPDFVAGRLRTDMVDNRWDGALARASAARTAAEVVARAIFHGKVMPARRGMSDGDHRTPRDGGRVAATSGWVGTARREATDRWP